MAIFVIVDIFEKLDDLLQYEITFRETVIFYLNFIPPIMVNTIPIAILLTTVSLFRRLSSTNEYVAMISGGYSLRSMLIPLMISVMVLGLFSFIMHNFVVPRSYFNQERIKAERFVREDMPSKKILKDVSLLYSEDHLMFISEYHIGKKVAKNITTVESSGNDLQKKKIMAEKAVWNGQEWIFKNVKIFDRRGGYISERVDTFPVLVMDIPVKPADLIFSKNKQETMSLRQLWSSLRQFHDTTSTFYRVVHVEFHNRFAFSLTGLVIFLVAVPFGLMQKRGPKFLSVGIGVVIGLLYYVILSIFLSFGKGGFLPALPSAWAANVIFMGISAVMLQFAPR